MVSGYRTFTHFFIFCLLSNYRQHEKQEKGNSRKSWVNERLKCQKWFRWVEKVKYQDSCSCMLAKMPQGISKSAEMTFSVCVRVSMSVCLNDCMILWVCVCHQPPPLSGLSSVLSCHSHCGISLSWHMAPPHHTLNTVLSHCQSLSPNRYIKIIK